MKRNREGFLVGDDHRECTLCGSIFKKTSKTVTLCNVCNTERVKSTSPEKKMLSRARNRAKDRGLDFDISVDDILIPIKCPVLGIPLKQHKGRSGGQPDSPALDRIDNSKGYVKGNVVVISHLANQMKSSATKEELIKFAEWILSEYRQDSNESC